MQSQRGDGAASDKTEWKGRGQQLRDSWRSKRDAVPRPSPAKQNVYPLEYLKACIILCHSELKRKFRIIVLGCWELKRKFRFTSRRDPGGNAASIG